MSITVAFPPMLSEEPGVILNSVIWPVAELYDWGSKVTLKSRLGVVLGTRVKEELLAKVAVVD